MPPIRCVCSSASDSPREEIEKRIVRVLEMVGLSKYRNRSATQLSGGQQQRLALARALAREPKLLLLDEPLSNLDAQLREQMRAELKRIQSEWGVTTVYVTHDQAEAMAISDRIAVLSQGKLMQIGPAEEIYEQPTSEFVANFIGRTNLFTGRLRSAVGPGEFGVVESDVGPVRCNFRVAALEGASVKFVARPENIECAKGAADGAENSLHRACARPRLSWRDRRIHDRRRRHAPSRARAPLGCACSGRERMRAPARRTHYRHLRISARQRFAFSRRPMRSMRGSNSCI